MIDFRAPPANDKPPGQQWSEWVPFQRSSNVAAARYLLLGSWAGGIWQVMFGGKERPITEAHPYGGITPISCYEYGPSPILTEELFWRWWQQYAAGGSAGIFLQVYVKDKHVDYRPLWTQGA